MRKVDEKTETYKELVKQFCKARENYRRFARMHMHVNTEKQISRQSRNNGRKNVLVAKERFIKDNPIAILKARFVWRFKKFCHPLFQMHKINYKNF